MTLQELQNKALQLPIGDRWRLVQLLLNSIQQETLLFNPPNPSENSLTGLDPWTQSLIGVKPERRLNAVRLFSRELSAST
jgi:hypothetical protein